MPNMLRCAKTGLTSSFGLLLQLLCLGSQGGDGVDWQIVDALLTEFHNFYF